MSERLLICEDCGRTCSRHLPAVVRCVRCGGRLHLVPLSPNEMEEELLRAQFQLVSLQRGMIALLTRLQEIDLITPGAVRDVLRILDLDMPRIPQ